jgi:hypothetical protein
VRLDVKASLGGSYERVFIDVEDAACKMCSPTMMGDSSCVVLGIPCLCGVDDGKRGRQVACRMAGGRARRHPQIRVSRTNWSANALYRPVPSRSTSTAPALELRTVRRQRRPVAFVQVRFHVDGHANSAENLDSQQLRSSASYHSARSPGAAASDTSSTSDSQPRVPTHKLFEPSFLDKQEVLPRFDNPKNCPRHGGTRIRHGSRL